MVSPYLQLNKRVDTKMEDEGSMQREFVKVCAYSLTQKPKTTKQPHNEVDTCSEK